MTVQTKQDRSFRLQPAPFNATRDVAECLDFARPFAGPPVRFDLRSEAALRTATFDEEDAMERERALWELADRTLSDSAGAIEAFIEAEPDRYTRRHAVWLLFQVLGAEAGAALEGLAGDGDPEIADWARVLLMDIDGVSRAGVYHEARVSERGAFDQTLPLLISGHVLVSLPEVGQAVARLSPLWFESIMGRVLACTNQATFATDLVIEKALWGFHPDGTDHYEIYKFRGMSGWLSDREMEHHYLSLTHRPFYPSGKLEQGEPVAGSIELNRAAQTRAALVSDYRVLGDGPRAERLAASTLPFVDSVRGRYHGWAAVDIPTVLAQGTVRAGDVQLSNPTDAVMGELTNARLYGTFRGKLSDCDGDGTADVNSVPCHGTVDGEHDLHCDGTRVPDPFL